MVMGTINDVDGMGMGEESDPRWRDTTLDSAGLALAHKFMGSQQPDW